MPVSPDDGMLFAPKWFVIGFALIALALIVNYDLRLGLAAGAVLGTFAALWLYFALRYGLVGDDRPTHRRELLGRFRLQLSNRSKAAADKDKGSGA
ncbi:MAG: hypothetical protein NBV60_04645 [Erythrobacter sp.]|nr:hypothetical protein [Erythrobacter sp.]